MFKTGTQTRNSSQTIVEGPALCWGIIIVAFFIRLYRISFFDFWFDEYQTLSYVVDYIRAGASWVEFSSLDYLLRRVSFDLFSFGYYLLVYLYSHIFKDPMALRVLSVFFSIVGLILYCRFAGFFLSGKKRWVAVGLMAASPVQVWYAQEARGYAIFFCVYMFLLLLYMRAYTTQRRSAWAYFFLGSFVAVCMDPVSFILVLTGILIAFRRSFWCWFGFVLSAVGITAVVLAHKQYFSEVLSWLPAPQGSALMRTISVFNLGYSATQLQHALGGIIFGGVAVRGCWNSFREDKQRAVMLVSFFVFPLLAVYIFSRMVVPVYLDRRLLCLLPFYIIVLAQGLGTIPRRWIRGSIMAVMVFLIACSLAQYYQGYMITRHDGKDYYPGVHKKKRYSREVVSRMLEEYRPTDQLYATNAYSMAIVMAYTEPWRHPSENGDIPGLLFFPTSLNRTEQLYMKRSTFIRTLPVDDRLYLFTVRALHVTEKSQFYGRAITPWNAALAGAHRLWLVSVAWNDTLSPNVTRVRAALHASFDRSVVFEHDGVSAELYVPRTGDHNIQE